MNLSAPFIHRPVMTTLVMVAMLFLGLLGFAHLPVSNLPDVEFPTITVTAVYPGTSPETMANTVATPMEIEFMTIPGITAVTSSNTLGNTSIVLEFALDKSIDSAAQDVEAALTRASGNLPKDLPKAPSYKKVNPSDSPILYLALTSDTMPIYELYTYGKSFMGQRLSTVAGVAQVMTYGAPYAVRVRVDPGQLAARGLTLRQVADAMERASPNLPTGQLDGNTISYIIDSESQIYNAEEYLPVIIAYKNGAPVRIGDIGTTEDSVNNIRIDLNYIDETVNQPTVVLAVQRQPGANAVAVSNAVRAYLPHLVEQLPASIQVRVVFDMADSIRDSIHEVELTLIIALILVVLVIFFYLGNPYDTLIPSLALPMSIIATFSLMSHFGYSLDNLSLLALTLATGFIVDDAIVVLENIVRHVELGKSRLQAALDGSAQISFTVLSMTLSLIAVFIPMIFMAGLIGRILQEFSMTMVIVIIASGVISLTLTPMLSSRFVTVEAKPGKIAQASHALNSRLLGLYERSLRWVLAHRVLGLFTGAVSVIASLLLFIVLPKDFIPDDDMGFIIGYTQAVQGTSPEEMFVLQKRVNELVRTDSNIASFVSIAGSPQVRQGIFFLRLKPLHERLSAQKVIQGLYKTLSQVTGIQVFLKNIPLINLSTGSNVRGAYQYTMQSLNTEELYTGAEKMIAQLEQLPLLQGVNSDLEIDTPQMHVEILRDQASRLGIEAKNIQDTLGLAYAGNRVLQIQTPYDQYDVILELEKKFQRSPEAFNQIYLQPQLGQFLVPLNTVTSWKEGVGPSSVNHFLQFPAVTVSFNLAPGVALGPALEAIDHLAEQELPASVIGSVQGAALKFKETVTSIMVLLVAALFAMYIILGILYESFIHPLTILSSLPPAVFGGLLTLYCFGLSLSLYGYLGIILLIGIVKKNGIMMIDYALQNMREKGETSEQSIIEACLVRFRPIMMTTMAAIMGALPIAIGWGSGGEARRPLGLVIVGGLLLSQLITLYLTPIIYLYLERLRERYATK